MGTQMLLEIWSSVWCGGFHPMNMDTFLIVDSSRTGVTLKNLVVRIHLQRKERLKLDRLEKVV